MNNPPVRLLIVDDSAFMRMAVKKMVEKDKSITIVGEARNGNEALELAVKLKPDVITMDVEMPEADGIGATRLIMQKQPTPIIMISSLTTQGAKTTIQALEAGAVDYISKSSSFVQLDIVKIEDELIKKLHYWKKNRLPGLRVGAATPTHIASVSRVVRPQGVPDLIVLAVSTGGPKQLLDLLASLALLKSPLVIAQHMGKEYTPSFAASLAAQFHRPVREGSHNSILQSDEIIICPGSRNTSIVRSLNGSLAIQVKDTPVVSVRPSADILFSSAAKVVRQGVAIIMTGMGCDGSEGARAFHEKGWPVLVQEPSSCIVNGMPQSAIDAGVVSEVLDIKDIAKRISQWAGK